MKFIKKLFSKKQKDISLGQSYIITAALSLHVIKNEKLRIEYHGIFKLRPHEIVDFKLTVSSQMSLLHSEIYLSRIAAEGMEFTIHDYTNLLLNISRNEKEIIGHSRKILNLK